MGGIRSLTVAAVAATLSGACGSSGTSPKAFEFTPAPLVDESGHVSESGIEPVIIAHEVVDGMDLL